MTVFPSSSKTLAVLKNDHAICSNNVTKRMMNWPGSADVVLKSFLFEQALSPKSLQNVKTWRRPPCKLFKNLVFLTLFARLKTAQVLSNMKPKVRSCTKLSKK